MVALHDRLASVYDRRWSAYVRSSNAATLRALEPHAHERILDVGCGTGAFLAELARNAAAAEGVGVDATGPMLAVARRRLPAATGLVRGWAEALPFRAAAFDAVVSSNALHFVHAPDAALAEMERVLRPGGRIVITDWCADHLSMRLLARWLGRRDPAHGSPWRSGEALEMVRRAGLYDARATRFRIGVAWGMMTIVALKPQPSG